MIDKAPSNTNDDTTTMVERSLSDSSAIPINEVVIREWELNENSTHYDRMVAAPKDEDLVKFWKGWASIMLITGVVTTLILIPLMSCRRKKVRKNPFNVYLIFLMIPDMLVAWICGFTCLSNAMAGHFTTPFMCNFQSFYMIAAIGSNSWLNLLITRQLYLMLDAARQFKRYPMPTFTRVVKESLAVYVYALFLATLGILPHVTWWPHRTRLTIGAACIPMDYSYASTAFFYGVFFPLLFGIPLAYVCWAAYQIYKHKMLPPSGRRRILAIYFFRLAAVFVIMWLPGLLLLFVMSAWIHPWVQWAGGSWSHLQGLVSALLILLKPDILKAVRDFWFCAPDYTLGLSDDTAANRQTSSIVTKKPWAASSVYWSSQIGLGSTGKNGKKIRNIQSRVSSYREADDDLEPAGNLNTAVESCSNALVSDDSVSAGLDPLERELEELEMDMEVDDRPTPLPSVVENPPINNLRTLDEESRGQSASSIRSHALSTSQSRRKEEEETDAPVGTIYIVPKA